MAKTTKRSKRGELTDTRRSRFLKYLREGWSIAHAATKATLNRRTLYRYKDKHQEFSDEWDNAVDEGTDMLEDILRERVVKGVERPVYYKGEVVGGVAEYSDTLLIFLLKGRRPEKFRDRVDISAADGSLAAAFAASFGSEKG